MVRRDLKTPAKMDMVKVRKFYTKGKFNANGKTPAEIANQCSF